MPGAAFFDLDRTLISRSSSLSLAPAFHRRGLLRRRDRTKATIAQLVFMRYGAGTSRVGQTAESAMVFLKGVRVEEMREIVEEAVDSAFRPHVYRDALDLVARHRERGERSFIVSAALQEIVDALVSELGFDGGIGSTAEVEDGAYTGRLARRLDGPAKAEALAELAVTEGIDLAGVDRVLRLCERRAVPRGGRSRGRRESRPETARDRSRAQLAGAAIQRQGLPGPMTEADARGRLRALGLDAPAVDALVAHFADAERRGKTGHGFVRVEWLATLDFDRSARPVLVESEEGFERWDGHGALGYLVLEEIVRATLADPPERARVVVARRCFPTGSLGYWVRRLAEGGLVAVLTATSPRRLPHPDGGPPLTGTNPLAIAIPSSDGSPVVSDVSMGAVTAGDVLAGRATADELVPFGGEHAHKAFALAVGLELLVGALAGPEHGAVLVVARPDHDPVPALRQLAAVGGCREAPSPGERARRTSSPRGRARGASRP